MRCSTALRAAWRSARGIDCTVRGRDLASSPHVLSLARRMSALVPPGKSLGEVTHVELLEKEDADAIEGIWREYHEGKEGKIGVTVDPNAYARFRDRSTTCPMFVMLCQSPSQFLTLVGRAKDASRPSRDRRFPKTAGGGDAHVGGGALPPSSWSPKSWRSSRRRTCMRAWRAAEHLTNQATRLLRLCQGSTRTTRCSRSSSSRSTTRRRTSTSTRSWRRCETHVERRCHSMNGVRL